MSQYFSLSWLHPYTPGEQPQSRAYIKLNTNENPYPLPRLSGIFSQPGTWRICGSTQTRTAGD